MRTLRLVHRRLGLALGLVMALVAVSGGLLLFRGAYERRAYPALAEPLTVSDRARVADRLDAVLARYPDARLLKLPREGANAFHLWMRDDTQVLVHPRTGAELDRWTWTSQAPAFVFELHTRLLLGEPGRTLNGAAALLLVFMGLTGLVLWAPRRATAFRLRSAIPPDLSPTALLRAHAAAGAVLLLPVLVFAATGAAIVFYTVAAPALGRARRPAARRGTRSAPNGRRAGWPRGSPPRAAQMFGTNVWNGASHQSCGACGTCGTCARYTSSSPRPTITASPPTCTLVIRSPSDPIAIWMRLGRPIFTPWRLTMRSARSRGIAPCATR